MRQTSAGFGLCVWGALLCAAPCWGQGPSAPSPDEVAIRQSAVKFVEAYNKHDAAALSELYGADARHEEASGLVIEGRDQIRAAYESAFQDAPRSALSLRLDTLRFLTDTVAVEQGASEFFPDGKTLTSRDKYLVVHLKVDGAWRMASVRSMEEEIVSNYQYLRDLEWLIGDWADESADAVVETHGHWAEGKNFLLLDFTVKQQGQVTLSGTQRIGWDPQAKQIRGWVFDTDGGFGESRWEPEEEGWLVKLANVTRDGRTASATRRFVLRDADHIDLTTQDRVSGGERLPDFTLTMSRKAPAPGLSSASR